MATIYRKVYPIPMPKGADVITRRGERLARWVDGNGSEKVAPLSADCTKIMHEAGPWYGRYRDADGTARRVSTGCNDEQAARKVLSDLMADVEKVRSGILTPAESHAAGHVARPIADHIADYLAFLKAKTVRGRRLSDSHRYNVEKQLKRLFQECGFKRIGDISRHRVVKWLGDQTDRSEKAPRTILKYRTTLITFCKWAVREGRLATNPLVELPGVAVDEDRRKRRALTLTEITALLDAAAARPLRDTLLIRRGTRKGQELAKVRQVEQERLVRLGQERALIYKTLIYTGLRKNELASLTVADLHLDGERPYAQLAARNAKNGKGAMISLRADLVRDLQEHLDERLARYRRQTLKDGRTEVPVALPGVTRLFNIPQNLVKIFDRDLAAAGIDKTNADGRTLDVHCLRHTFATLLSKSGVAPRMAQELMRHSDIRLTMNTYTHLQLIDTAGAVETLPSIGMTQRDTNSQRPTGTNG
jgi:integrase